MDRSIKKELSGFIRSWRILGPAFILISLGMVFFSWPDRWLAWLVLLLALFFGFFIRRHARLAARALELVRSGQPEECLVEIRKESGDSRDYFKGTIRRKSGEKWDISELRGFLKGIDTRFEREKDRV